MLHFWCIVHHRSMPSPFLKQAFAYWNWKCALMSAAARSLIYLAAMAHNGLHGTLPIVLVEVGYVTLTAGVYAGIQQNALRLPSRVLGNLIVVVGVPGLAQVLDWFAHRLTHTAATGGTTVAVSFFAVLPRSFTCTSCATAAFSPVRAARCWTTFAACRGSCLDSFCGQPHFSVHGSRNPTAPSNRRPRSNRALAWVE